MQFSVVVLHEGSLFVSDADIAMAYKSTFI
jgi:hypothetical protein